MVELADALDLGSSGRPWGFESLYAHHSLSEKGKTAEILMISAVFLCPLCQEHKKRELVLPQGLHYATSPFQRDAPRYKAALSVTAGHGRSAVEPLLRSGSLGKTSGT